MKKIILIVGGIAVVAILGRAIWAYQQVRNDDVGDTDNSLIAPTNPPMPAQVEIQQPQTQVVVPSKADTLTKLVDTYPAEKSVILATWSASEELTIDNNIKRLINDARSLSEIYYDQNGGSYAGVCTKNSSVLNIKTELAKISDSVVCKDSAIAWAMSAHLASDVFQYQCVDFPSGVIIRNSPITSTSCR